jgi:ABC-type lipoprotein release transport system permease subunit
MEGGNLTGTLAFSRFVLKDIFRSKGRTISSIIGVALAVSLIAGENIALDSTAKDVLEEELEKNGYDYYASSKAIYNQKQLHNISRDLLAVDGIEEVLIFLRGGLESQFYSNTTLDVHNNPPIYGYYNKSIDVNIPINSTVWLDTTLEQIPSDIYKLYGYVFYQESGDPVQDVDIKIEEGEHAGYSIVNRTDKQGYYEFFLPESQFQLDLTLTSIWSGYPETYLSTSVEIDSSEPEKRLDFYIPEMNSSIQGYILDSSLGEPYKGEVCINIWNRTEKTNGTLEFIDKYYTYDGSYYLHSISGNMTLFGWTDDGVIDYFQVEIPANTSVFYNITIAPTPDESVVIEGYVYDNLSGQPLGSARLFVKGIDKLYENENYTDDFGYFFMNVIPGNISITIEKITSSPYDTKYLVEEFKTFNPAGEILQMDFYLEPMTSILKGYVTLPLGEDIKNLDIRLEGTKIEKKKASNYWGRGYYEIEVPAGNYTITFDAPPRNSPFRDIRNLYIFGINPSLDQLEFFQDAFKIDLKIGSLDFGQGNIAVSEELAEKYHIEVGSQVTFLDEFWVWDETNGTDVLKEITLSYNVSAIMVREDSFDLLMSMEDMSKLFSDLSGDESALHYRTVFYLRLDSYKMIDPFLRESTDISLTKFALKINAQASKYNLTFEDHLDTPLSNYYTWLSEVRLELIAYSLPVIGLGLYLGVVGIRLTAGQKRRVIGILKSRGASNRQIFISQLIEGVVLGIIAGFTGLIVGVIVSRFLLTVIPGSRNVASSPEFFAVNITSISILITILFAILLMIVTSLRPIRQASKATILQSLHHHVDVRGEKKYKPARDIFLVSFAVFALIVVSHIDLRYLDPENTGYYFWAFIFVVYIVSMIWLPFSPFIMIFCLTRLLTMGTTKIYKLFSRIVKPFTGNLWYLIQKNIVRNPKRVSSVSIIIALSLGFGVFMTTMIATTTYGWELEVRTEIGADLHIYYREANMSFENDLKGIEGVEEVIPVQNAQMIIQDAHESEWIRTMLFNATEYKKYVEVPDYYFVEGSSGKALSSLSKGNSIIITRNLAQLNSWGIGSTLRIERIEGDYGYSLNLKNTVLKVVGIVRALPGLDPGSEENRVYIDFNAMKESPFERQSHVYFLVDVRKGYDSNTVENSIDENFETLVFEIRNLEEEINAVRNDLSSRSILYIMLVDIGFMIIIITAGLALILFISINERKNELATIMARGADTKQVSVLIMGEAFAIAMVGIVIGVSVGLFTAYSFNEISVAADFFGMGGNTFPGRPLIIPWYGFIVIFLALISLTTVSILAAYRVKNIDLNQELRIRGG